MSFPNHSYHIERIAPHKIKIKYYSWYNTEHIYIDEIPKYRLHLCSLTSLSGKEPNIYEIYDDHFEDCSWLICKEYYIRETDVKEFPTSALITRDQLIKKYLF